MKKLLTAVLILSGLSLSAQTLFYYGNDSVSAQDFLRAYEKNKTGPGSEKELREYLDLYIASRLKIKEAKSMGIDTMPQIKADLINLRNQIVASYLNDDESMQKLVNEAFQRSQKNVRASHIYLRNGADLETKKAAVLAALKSNSFEAVARKYSEDPAVKDNGGDLGWVAVFGLPYEIENLIYQLPVGGTSQWYATKNGVHLFRNDGERRDPGRIKAAQILLAFPPDANASLKMEIKQLADSIYMRLKKGDDFGKLATQFSNDIISAAANGQMQEFGAGQYDADFEQAVLALPKDGAYTQPFLTSHGYHIVKRIGRTPAKQVLDEKLTADLKEKIAQSDRMMGVKKGLIERIKKQTGFRGVSEINSSDLYAYTDSVMLARYSGKSNPIRPETVVLQIGKDPYKVSDWMEFVQRNRYKSDGNVRAHAELWPAFSDAMALRYYEAHLEDYNPAFRQQLAEFSDGNLFFEIMQQKIWGPAQSDSLALMQYYQSNAGNYNWKSSADAILFYFTDPVSARPFAKELRKDPWNYRELVFSFNYSVASDSTRIELDQIPNPTKLQLKRGVITEPLVNKQDNTASMALILKLYPKPEPRNFEQSRAMVINDYQSALEKQWLEELKKKYPVVVKEAEVRKLVVRSR